MPWTESQMRLWRAAAHNPSIARSRGISRAKAREFMSEGVKRAEGGLARYAAGGDVSRIPLYQMGNEQAPRAPGLIVPSMFSFGSIARPAAVASTLSLAAPSGPPPTDIGRSMENESELTGEPGSFGFTPGMALSGARTYMAAAPYMGPIAALGPAAISAVASGLLGKGLKSAVSGLSSLFSSGYSPEMEPPGPGVPGHYGLTAGFTEETPGMPPASMIGEEQLGEMFGGPAPDDPSGSVGPGGDPTGSGAPGGGPAGMGDAGPSGGGSSADSDNSGSDDGSAFADGGLVRYLRSLPRDERGDFLENIGKFAGGGDVLKGVMRAARRRVDPYQAEIYARELRALDEAKLRALANEYSMDATRGYTSQDLRTLLDNPGMNAGRIEELYDLGASPLFRFYRRGYADGGEVDAGSMAAGLGAGLGAAALRPRIVNRLARPFMRPFAKPALGMEAVSHSPLSERQSDARYALARTLAGGEFSQLPVWRGQGAWQGEKGMEYNPLYVTELPRVLGPISGARKHLRYASQMGENLEQAATPVGRFVPNLINTPSESNALMVSGIDRGKLRTMAELLGPDVVVAHRPGNKALAFPLGDQSVEDLATEIRARFNFPRIRFGRSDPKTDRMLLSREPLGFEDALYSKYGVEPRSTGYDLLDREAIDRPTHWLGGGK